MNNFRYRLCDVFGIPLYLDFSLIFLLLFFVLGGNFHQGIVCAAILLVSITAHELGHALTARAFGYPTRDITLSLLGGCASLIALPRKAWQEFLTAVAGPAVSFILAAVGALCISFVAVEGSFADAFGFVVSDALSSFRINVDLGGDLYFDRDDAVLVSTFFYLSIMNMILGLFNLLPGFPMDGGRIFRSAMVPAVGRVKATYYAMMVGRVFAVVLGFVGVWRVMNGLNWGFLTVLIAWMIWKEGYREYMMAKLESAWRFDDYRAKASPPPYGGSGSESDVSRD